MKRNHKDRSQLQMIRLWTHDQAVKALPYLRSVMRSLRDYWLELNQARQTLRRLDAKHGRPARDDIIAREGVERDVDSAADRFEEALADLNHMDVYLLDPACGQALIPFRQGDDLAWYVYDLFDGGELRSWRFHHDPLETRRPVTGTDNMGTPSSPLPV